MLGRAGSWVGTAASAIFQGRFWLYDSVAAASGPGITITENENGSGGSFVFDATKIVDNSAAVTDAD